MNLTTFTALAMLLSAGYAFAGDGAAGWYIAANLASGKCEMMATQPDATKYKLLGIFKTREGAQRAMGVLEIDPSACGG